MTTRRRASDEFMYCTHSLRVMPGEDRSNILRNNISITIRQGTKHCHICKIYLETKPRGYFKILFIDGDPYNYDLSNLALICKVCLKEKVNIIFKQPEQINLDIKC